MIRTPSQALEFINENDVKFIRLQFCDLYGNLKNISINPSQMEKAFEKGIGFDASSILGFASVNKSDLFLFPIPKTLCVLPWRPQKGKVIRFFCEIKYPNGEAFESDSRLILKNALKEVKELGYEVKVGAECEFYLLEVDEEGRILQKPQDDASYLDIAPLERGETARREICLIMEEMGIKVESSHHEVGKGQNEIVLQYDEPIIMAENILTLKNVSKTIASMNGFFATFMPKPFGEDSGSALHINISLHKDGKNLFSHNNKSFDNEQAKYFIGGILKYANEILAITNPSVNSYKRLGFGFEAPGHIAWSFENRSSLIRIPAIGGENSHIEIRNPDPMCNPYLTIALLIRAGIKGIKNKIMPLNMIEDNLYESDKEIEKLHPSLKDALIDMKGSSFVKEALGNESFEKYLKIKEQEWEEYEKTVHDWEIKRYLKY